MLSKGVDCCFDPCNTLRPHPNTYFQRTFIFIILFDLNTSSVRWAFWSILYKCRNWSSGALTDLLSLHNEYEAKTGLETAYFKHPHICTCKSLHRYVRICQRPPFSTTFMIWIQWDHKCKVSWMEFGIWQAPNKWPFFLTCTMVAIIPPSQ